MQFVAQNIAHILIPIYVFNSRISQCDIYYKTASHQHCFDQLNITHNLLKMGAPYCVVLSRAKSYSETTEHKMITFYNFGVIMECDIVNKRKMIHNDFWSGSGQPLKVRSWT